MHLLQPILVALLVGGCFAYAVWTLAPRSLRRWLAPKLLQWPLPGFLKRPLQAAMGMQGGCGCDGCDGQPEAAPVKPVQLLRGDYRRKPPPP